MQRNMLDYQLCLQGCMIGGGEDAAYDHQLYGCLLSVQVG